MEETKVIEVNLRDIAGIELKAGFLSAEVGIPESQEKPKPVDDRIYAHMDRASADMATLSRVLMRSASRMHTGHSFILKFRVRA
jgi:hypothetical protein